MTTSKERNKVKDGIAFTGKSWSYVLRIPDPVTGRTKPKWVGGFETQEAALLARDEARVSLRKRTYVPPSERTVTEFIHTWLFTIHRQQLKPTTFHSYEKIVRNHIIPGLGAIKLSDLKPSDVQRFYSETVSKQGGNGKPLTPRTAQYAGAILKKALKYAVEVEGVLSFNPASRVPLPKTVSDVPTPWTFRELREFLELAKSHRLFFFFRLFLMKSTIRLAANYCDSDRVIAKILYDICSTPSSANDSLLYEFHLSLFLNNVEHSKNNLCNLLYCFLNGDRGFLRSNVH
jgi:hypothetical protein